MTSEKNRGWFLLIYKLPSNPSTARVTVWKKARELGSLPLQQSVYILPDLPELKASISLLKEKIQQFGGECKLLEVSSLGEGQERAIIAEFNKLRNQEYKEVEEEGRALLDEIERESKEANFHFAELEEIEKRLQRLKEWIVTVSRRDFFGSGIKEEVIKLLENCEDKYNIYSQEVYSGDEIAAKRRNINVPDLMAKQGSMEINQNMSEIHSKDELIAKLKEVVNDLENETLKIGEEVVSKLPELFILEMKHKRRQGITSLKIDIRWESFEGSNYSKTNQSNRKIDKK